MAAGCTNPGEVFKEDKQVSGGVSEMKGHRIDNNFSLFEEADSPKSNSGNKLEVVKLVYDHADSVTWQDGVRI